MVESGYCVEMDNNKKRNDGLGIQVDTLNA